MWEIKGLLLCCKEGIWLLWKEKNLPYFVYSTSLFNHFCQRCLCRVVGLIYPITPTSNSHTPVHLVYVPVGDNIHTCICRYIYIHRCTHTYMYTCVCVYPCTFKPIAVWVTKWPSCSALIGHTRFIVPVGQRLLRTVLAKSFFLVSFLWLHTSLTVMFRLCSWFIAYGNEWDVWLVKRMQDSAKCSRWKCQRCVSRLW